MKTKSGRLLIQMLLTLLMIYSISVVIGKALLLEWSLTTQFFFVFGIGSALLLFMFVPQSLLGCGLLLAGTGVYLSQRRPEQLIKGYQWLIQFLTNVKEHLEGIEAVYQFNSPPLWLLLVGIIGLYTIWVVLRVRRVVFLLPFYLSAFAYYWYLYIDVAYFMLGLFLLCYFIQQGIEGCHTPAHYPLWLRTSLVYALIIVMTAGFLPKLGPIVTWGWVDTQARTHVPGLYAMRNDLIYSRSFGRSQLFDFAQTGFQNEANRLGGPVELGDQVVMEVKAPYPLYLRGNVKAYYEDSFWWPMAEKQTGYQMNGVLPAEVISGVPVSLEITHINLASQTLFAPYQPVRIRAQRVRSAILGDAYQMRFNGAIFKGESYRVEAVLPSANQVSQADWVWSQDMEPYLQLPEQLGSQVKALADKIIRESHARTPLDQALALQDYLRSHYTYTLTPNEVPENQDFLSYFLFVEKEGYCTYFATALATMLRTQGIPTRYVEGYLMSAEKDEDRYLVRENNAHAWVEAYLGSAGWITLEATPAFAAPDFQEEAVAGETSQEAGEMDRQENEQQVISALDPVDDSYLLEDFAPVGNGEAVDISHLEPVFEGLWKQSRNALWIIFLLGTLGFAPAYALYRFYQRRRYQGLLKRAPLHTQVVYRYGNILWMLDQMKMPKEPGETVTEYAWRMRYKIVDGPFPFEEITEIFIRAQYGGKSCTEGEHNQILWFEQWAEEKVRRRMGKISYFYEWMIKGKGLKIIKSLPQPVIK